MKVQKEGLTIYMVEEFVQNEYFLSVEYQTLRLNRPEKLVPVLLREKDGKRVLLYDITDGKNLMNIADGKGFSWEDCQYFLKNFLELMDEVENFMLELEHISFEPEHIYRKDEKHFQWMYLPDKKNDVRTGIESFFAWMLSQIDYGDGESVKRIYHVYWSIRNRSFSREMIEECLEVPPERKEKGIVSYEEFFPEKEVTSVPKKEEKKAEIKRNPAWQYLMVGLSFLLVVVLIATVYFLVMWIQNDLWRDNLPYLIASGIGMLFLMDGIYQAGRRGWNKEEKTKKMESSGSEEVLYEDEEKTTVLHVRRDSRHPVLKSMETGEVTGLYTFPFYIGNLSGLNQLIIDDETVSRQHAVILRGNQEGNYMIQDLHSTNGTQVDEEWLLPDKPVRLEDGSRICFAARMFQFKLVEAPF